MTDSLKLKDRTVLAENADLKCSEYFGVQFAQGQYLMHWEAPCLTEITEKLFAKKCFISVEYAGLGNALGREEVSRFFRKMDELRKKNGGLLCMDLPHTQKITVDEDGAYATGEWETLTLCVMGAAFGNSLTQAPLDYAIGRFKNRFVLEDGVWKIQSVRWAPVIRFGHWKCKDATKVYGRPFPKPFETLRPVDDHRSSERARTICSIRNQVMGFFHDFNHDGLSSIDDRFSQDGAREAWRMLHTPFCPGGYHGTVLATSPIIRLEGERALFYVNIGRILPVNENHIAHSRGRVCGELHKTGHLWNFHKFHWYRYATMEPWEVNGE